LLLVRCTTCFSAWFVILSQGFQTAVISELCKRSIEPVPPSADADGRSVAQSHPATLANAAGIIAELVDLEKNVLQHREIYSQAAMELEVSAPRRVAELCGV